MRQISQVLLVFFVCLGVPLQAQQRTPKRIFTDYRAAIIRIITPVTDTSTGQTSIATLGTGFVITSDLIVTANHVVTSADRLTYLPALGIELSNGKRIAVKPVLNAPTQDAREYDYAVLQPAEQLKPANFLRVGSWKSVEEGDDLTTIGYSLNLQQPVLLSCMASAVYIDIDVATGKRSNVIVFQGPSNRGLSGSPLILNRTGEVVGIVSFRLAGITLELERMRAEAAKMQDKVVIGGGGGRIAPGAAVVELTNVLDRSLTSGMGTAYAIDYLAAALPKKAQP